MTRVPRRVGENELGRWPGRERSVSVAREPRVVAVLQWTVAGAGLGRWGFAVWENGGLLDEDARWLGAGVMRLFSLGH